MQIGAATVENSMEIFEKFKNGAASWPSDFTSANISEETELSNSEEYMHLCVHWNIIYNSQYLEAAQVSIIRGVNKKLW